MSVEARLLFLYHLTSERSTPFLLYIEGPGAIADALRMPSGMPSGMPSLSLGEAMNELSKNNLVWYADDGSNGVFLPNALKIKENAPQSLNAVKSWVEMTRDLPKTPFILKCFEHWLGIHEAIPHAFTKAFVEALPKAYPMLSVTVTGPVNDLKRGGVGEKVELPEWLDPSVWSDFLVHRNSIKRSMSEHAQILAIKKLTELRSQNQDPTAVLEQSILNGWQGLFPVKSGSSGETKADRLREVTARVLKQGLK